MNVTNQDQVMSGGTIIAHGEPAVWAAIIDDQSLNNGGSVDSANS